MTIDVVKSISERHGLIAALTLQLSQKRSEQDRFDARPGHPGRLQPINLSTNRCARPFTFRSWGAGCRLETLRYQRR